MRRLVAAALAALLAVPAVAVPQGQSAPPIVSAADPAAQAAAAQAQSTADQALAAAGAAVQSVNGVAPVSGNVAITIPPAPDLTPYATKTSVPLFVANGVYMPRATLKASYPCGSSYLGMLGHVNDAWGSVSTTFICESSGTMFYWRPQRTDNAGTITFTGGALTLTPLVTPPVIYLSGNATSNGTITPATTDVWPGASFTVVETGTLGLFSVQIGGLVGGLLNFVTGGAHQITWACTAANVCGWQGN